MSKTRMGKRVASLLLSLVMMLSLLPTTVYATGDTGETKNAIVEETNTSDDNTVGGTTGNPELTGEDEGGGGTIGSEGETVTVATIGEAKYETLDEAITAVADGETIVVNAGEYTLNGSLNYTGKAFTIAAADGADVSFDMSAAVALHGAKITFNNVTFDYKTNGNYIGLQHTDTLVYNNCIINGMVFLYAVNETFNSCTFNQTSAGAYNVWTYGAQNVAFNGCTFNCVGRCVLVYNEGTDHKTDLTVTKTSFNASAPVTGKAAIEIDTSLMKNGGATITVDEQTKAEGFAAGSNSGNSLWNDKMQTADTNKNTTVTVGGVEVFVPKATASAVATTKDGREYATLTEALAAVTESNPLTSVTEEAWPAATPVYYNGSFYATIGELLYDAQQKTGAIAPENAPDTAVIYCRPGTTILTGKASHPSFVTSTTIYGNGATLSGVTEWDVENYYTLTKDITINLYSLNGGASVWGTRRSDYAVTVNMVDCKDAHEVLFNYGSGNGRVIVTVKDSTFLKSGGAAHGWPVSINCLGSLLVDGCTFDGVTTGVVVNVKQPSENGKMDVTVKNSTFNDVTGQDSNKGALRVTGQKACDIDLTIENVAFTGTHADPEDITIGNVKSEENLGKVSYNISGTDASMTTHKAGATEAAKETLVSGTTYTGTNAATAAGDGTEAKPYTLEQLGAMTRKAYIEAQNRLNGTMYVTVGDYAYDTNGVLGNGVRDDTTGQIPDHSKLNAYGENGYLGEKNDGANGKSVVFVGGSITSGVTGYTSIDHIGTSLLLALPAYTNVTFKGITFNNVMSFNYQLYTSPWSQLGELKFDGCTFNGIIVGAIAAQTLTFNGCVFENYTNTTAPNSSNPTWIRPAYGNWAQGDNEGQGSDFKSLTTINFTGNTVTSTRPVKFEYISQWDITSTVTATGNSFDISRQAGDTTIKNVGLYLGAHTDANAFILVAENNTKSKNTAALYTIPEGKTSLPLGSTVTDTKGNEVELADALKWKAGDAATDKIVLKTEKAVASVGSKQYSSLQAAIDAATAGETVKLLKNATENVEIAKEKNLTLDLNGCTLNGGTVTNKAALYNLGTVTIQDTSEDKAGTIKRDDTGAVGEKSYYVIQNRGTMTIESGNVINNSGYEEANPTGSMVGSSLICNGDCDEGGTLTINGGTFTQNNFIAIKNGALGVLHVTGGKISSNHSAIQNWFKAEITGGEIKGQLWTDAYIEGESVGKTTIGGDATFTGEIVMDIYGRVAPTLAITGGNLNVTKWRITTAAAKAGAKPAVSGGTFSSAVKEEYCATGYIPKDNGDGTYGVKEGVYVAKVDNVKYETLQAAINAAKRNATVTMLANTRENVTISTPYLTLDLNGFTLNGGTEKGKPALTVTARVTVKDSSTAQTGTIMREDTAENSGVSSHYVIDVQGGGWLTFESGTVKNNSGNANGKGASLVRVGDDRVAKFPGLNIKGGTFTQDNFIVIKVDRGDLFLNGGILTSANSYAIEDWHRATIKGGTVNGTVAAWTYSGGHNSDLTIEGGTVNGNVASVSYDKTEGKLAKVSITGGTVTGTLGTYTYNNGLDPIENTSMATIEVTGGTFDKDPTKYVVEGSTVKTNSEGKFGVEKAYLAKVGDTSYYTMDEAFKAQTASGEPIVMLRDYTTGSPFKSGSINRTVDLNGYTWTCTGTDTNSAAFEINYPDVTLTVKNGKIVSSQLVGLIPSAMGGTIKYDNAGLVFEDVVMTTTAHSGIETNGNNTNDAVTLKNSTLKVPDGFGIYFPSSGTLTIDNSTINAKTMGVQVCAGSLSINAGSAITVTGDAVPKTENDGAIQDGAAISIVDRTGYKDLGVVTVTGGKFTAKTGNEAIKAYDWANNTETEFTAAEKVAVSGGTFSSAVPEGLCAPGFIPTTNGDGTYGVKAGVYVAQIGDVKYETLKDAINAANTGDTVKLLRDINTPDISYVISKSLTIDLNGMTVTGSGYDAVFQIDNADAKVVIKNGKVVAAEQSDSAGKKYTMAIWARKAGCEVTLEGLDVSQKITHTDDPQMDMIYASGGTITINSGNFVSGTPAWTLNCYGESYTSGEANIIVKGGTFANFDPANNKAEGENTNFVAAGYVSNMNEDGSYTVVPKDASIKVNKRLTIGNDLTMTYLVTLTGCTDAHVKFQFYNDDFKGYTEVMVENGTKEADGRFAFDFTGINPQRMTDTLKATVYATDLSGGTIEYQVDDYSVAQYCINTLKKSTTTDSVKKLIGNLVAYGTAAQLYKNYRKDNLVSSIVTGVESTDYVATELSKVTSYGTITEGTAGIKIASKTLVLSNTFAVRVYFTLDEGIDIGNVSFKVTANGKENEVDSFQKDSKGRWYFDYAKLNATQLDSKVTFESFVVGTESNTTGDTLEYSVNSYLAKMMPKCDESSDLYTFMAELFNYGCACKNFK